jgi:hypothetical protein
LLRIFRDLKRREILLSPDQERQRRHDLVLEGSGEAEIKNAGSISHWCPRTGMNRSHVAEVLHKKKA